MSNTALRQNAIIRIFNDAIYRLPATTTTNIGAGLLAQFLS